MGVLNNIADKEIEDLLAEVGVTSVSLISEPSFLYIQFSIGETESIKLTPQQDAEWKKLSSFESTKYLLLLSKKVGAKVLRIERKKKLKQLGL